MNACNDMKATLSVACLGAGYFSRYHYDAWQRHPNVELVASADTDLSRAQQTPARHAFQSLASMMTTIKPDVLDIITPPPTHLQAIREAVEFEPQAIVCQKPFCNSRADAEKAIAIAESNNIPLVIHENFRFQPWFRRIKQALQEKAIGNVLQACFRMRTGDGQGENAYIDRQAYFRTMPRLLVYETGVHYVDTFQYLFGDIVSVYADLHRHNPIIQGEDAAYVLFEHENGVRSVYDGNRLLDHHSPNPRLTFGEALFEGTQGVIQLGGDGGVTLRRFGQSHVDYLLKPSQWSGFAGDCVYALQDHLVHALLHGKTIENQARDYLPVQTVVDTIYDSAERGVKLFVNHACKQA